MKRQCEVIDLESTTSDDDDIPSPPATVTQGETKRGAGTGGPANALLAELRRAREARGKAAAVALVPAVAEVSVLSLNLWFGDNRIRGSDGGGQNMRSRMAGVSALVNEHAPDVILFQEVTAESYELLSSQRWWIAYTATAPSTQPYFTTLLSRRALDNVSRIPFKTSLMGRDLLSGSLAFGSGGLLVGTGHLESPVWGAGRWNSANIAERQDQMKQALALMSASEATAALFAGDFNWCDRRDKAPPLPPAWTDAWSTLHGTVEGATYDELLNTMITPTDRPPSRKRYDRVLVRGAAEVKDIKLVGNSALSGLKGLSQNGETRPVFISDHFALLVRLRSIS